MSMILTTLSITSEGRDHYHPRVCSGKSLPIFFKPIKQGTPKLHEPSVHMDSETFCESCFFSSALCSCSYFLSSQLPGFSEGDIITTADGAERQQWISHNGSILHNVGPVVPPRSVLPDTAHEILGSRSWYRTATPCIGSVSRTSSRRKQAQEKYGPWPVCL